MKYDSTAEFMDAVKEGKFSKPSSGSVLVDYDFVRAYLTHDENESMDVVCVYDFEDRDPRGVLIELLEHLGLTVEIP